MSPTRVLLLTLPVLSLAPLSADLTSQATSLNEQLDRFARCANDKSKAKDKQAVEILEAILATRDKLKPKQLRAIAKRIRIDCLLSPRCKRDPRNDNIYRVSVRTLSHLGTAGSSVLMKKVFGHDRFKRPPWDSLRGEMLEAIGRTKDKSAADFLVDQASRHPTDALRAKAGAALRHYEKADLKLRVELVKQLIRSFASIKNAANGAPSKLQTINANRRLAAVQDSWNGTLRKLTRESRPGPAEWEDFLSKRNKEWAELRKGRRRSKSGSRPSSKKRRSD